MQIEGIQEPKSRIEPPKADNTQLLAILAIFNEIRKNSKTVIDEISSGITVNNLDEITTAIHNETNRNASSLLKTVKDLKISGDNQNKLLEAIQKLLIQEIKLISSQKQLDKIEVTNLSEISRTEEVKINNLSELITEIKNIENVIKDTFNIPAPQIIVNPTEVHIPAPIINIPDLDLNEVVNELSVGLKKLRQNNMSNPVFVRITDLDRVLEKLDSVRQASKEVMLGFPGSIRIQNATGGTVDFNTIGGNVFQLVPKVYDYISLSPASQPTTIIYKTGGAGGTTVATLTITYSGTDISTVTRT